MNIQAAVTMRELQHRIDQIGNNVANVNTPGYKSQIANFSALMYQNIDNLSDVEQNAVGRTTPHGIRIGSGARLSSTKLDLSSGSLQMTDRGLDIALVEETDFLQVQVNENNQTETRYTRDGRLYLNNLPTGQLVLSTQDGHPVLGQTGEAIVISENIDAIRLNETGQVIIEQNQTEIIAGQLALVRANRPEVLEKAGANLFRLPNLELANDDLIINLDPNQNQIQTGMLESSNVDLAEQMSELLQTQRAYQFNARTISMHDQMRGLINQLR